MKKNNTRENRFRDLLDGQDGLTEKEIGELKDLYDRMDDQEIPEPPGSLDEKFYSSLDKEIRKDSLFLHRLSGFINKESFRSVLRIAAGIALFIMGWFGSSIIGSTDINNHEIAELTTEVAELKQSLVLTMLTKESPSDRIMAVNMAGEMSQVDSKIISGMLSTLNNDPNDNVRLVALETLASYAEYPEVREGLIRSIPLQESPMIQYRLAELMEMLGEKGAVPEFRKVLDDLTLDYNVRERINQTLEVLL